MDHKQLSIGFVALVIGLGVGYMLNTTPVQVVEDDTAMHGEMESMTGGLKGKVSDDFDKAFLAEMIVHHEGAIDMAEAALQNAKHEEIKTMANAIISAQTSEIVQMKEWLSNWYGQ